MSQDRRSSLRSTKQDREEARLNARVKAEYRDIRRRAKQRRQSAEVSLARALGWRPALGQQAHAALDPFSFRTV